MECLKCGKDTTGEQIFCDKCQENMDAYPIKPGTVVTLPAKKIAMDTKKPVYRRRPLTSDEQIAVLHKQLRRSRIYGFILTVLLLAASGLLVYEIMNPGGPIIGQNYTIDTTMGTD